MSVTSLSSHKKAELEITEIKNYSFKGLVWASALDLCPFDQDVQLKIEGDFTVIFIDSDFWEVTIETVAYFYGGEWRELEQKFYDYDECCDFLMLNGDSSDWYTDYQSALADYYYDMWRDG